MAGVHQFLVGLAVVLVTTVYPFQYGAVENGVLAGHIVLSAVANEVG